MRQLRPTLALLLLSLTATLPVQSQDYDEHLLENGLRVVLMRRPEVPMVTLTSIVGAGSALEEESFSGASHLLEHLLFNGTEKMSQEELYAAVDRIGGYNNAHTDDDHTYYVLLVPSEHLRRGLEIQAAMLFDSTIPASHFEKERKIVLEELAKDRSRPGYELETEMRRSLWPDSAWGRPVIGTYDSLAGIDRERVWQYYRRQYVPGNIKLLVIGDFEAEQALEWVGELYDGPGGGEIPEVSDPWQGVRAGEMLRLEAEEEQPRLSLVLPAPGACEPGGRETEILAELLASESGPLRARLGDQAQSISAHLVSRPRGSALEIEVLPARGTDPEALLEPILETLEVIAREGTAVAGVDPTSILRVARSARSSEQLVGQRLHYLGMMLADRVASCEGSPRSVLISEMVEPERVAEVAATVLASSSSRARAIVAGPGEGGAAALPEVSAPARSDAPAMTLVPGVDFDRTLQNGMRVLASREPGSEVVGFHLLVAGRSAREPEGRDGLADVLHRMLPEGTALSDRARLEARLQRIGAELKTADSDFIPYDDYYTEADHSFVRLEVPKQNWLPALDLLAELVRTATLPEGALDSLLEARIRRAEKVAGAPAEVGAMLYRKAMLGDGNPYVRWVGGQPDTLRGVTLEELFEFGPSYFDPGGFILSVVSPEPPEDVFGAVDERFGSSWGAGVELPTALWPVTGEPGPVVREVLGADQSRFYLGRIAALGSEERAALSILAAVLSDRLIMTLREKEGLAYRLGAGVSFASEPELAWMTISIGTRAENLEAAEAGIRREMQLLASSGTDLDEIDRIRAGVRSRALMRRMTAVNRARYLGLRAFRGVPSQEDLDFLDAMDRVEPAQLQELAATWLDPELYRFVILE